MLMMPGVAIATVLAVHYVLCVIDVIKGFHENTFLRCPIDKDVLSYSGCSLQIKLSILYHKGALISGLMNCLYK